MTHDSDLDVLLPAITELNKPFYEFIEKGQLAANKCNDCDHIFLPAAEFCPNCLSSNLEWTVLSGEGLIYSWVEYHRAYHDAFKDKIPYVVAIVQLKEGPRLISNIIDYDADTLKTGFPIKAVFNTGIGDYPIVQFKPKNGKEG